MNYKKEKLSYKNQDWFKKLKYKYPAQAKYLDDSYNVLPTSAYMAAGGLRTLLEANIECIGEMRDNKKWEEDLNRNSKQRNDLADRIEILKKNKILGKDEEIYNLLHSIRQTGNGIHDGEWDVESQKKVRSSLSEMESYLEWFADTYIDEDIEYIKSLQLDDNIEEPENSKPKIKYCSNKKQCGRIYREEYPYHICLKCGALIEQIEKDNDEYMNPELEIQETLNHYISIQYNNDNNYELKGRIKLDSKEIIIGRESDTSDYKIDIDLTKYIDNEEYHREISRKHAMIYKQDNTFYIRNLSKKDNLIFLNKSSEKEIIIKENEARELSKDEIVSFSNYLICIEYLVE